MIIPSHTDSCTASAPSSPEELAGPTAAARMAQPEDGSSGPDSPRLVIRGESSHEGQADGDHIRLRRLANGMGGIEFVPQSRQESAPYAALTDWLNVTFPFPGGADAVGTFFGRFGEAVGGIFGGMTDQGRGKYGYTQSFVFDRGGVLFAVGAQRGTALISIPGEGCAFVADWDPVVALFRDELRGRITRWDGAVDDFEGTHSVDGAVSLYRQGGFGCGGNQPSSCIQGDWLGSGCSGRTLYVGKRGNGKLLRIYEKGKQQGDPVSPWVRWELELHNVDRVIPWDVLLEPGRYVAGSYGCMAWVQDEMSRIRTVKAQDSISYDRLKQVGATAYGALINVMVEREGSAERVVEMLRRPGAPRRLQFTDDYLRTVGDPDAV